MSKSFTTHEFIEKSRLLHGTKYSYPEEYVNIHSFIKIICPIHGEFLQKAYTHLNGGGCRKCGRDLSSKKQKTTTEKFINQAKLTHKYDYSKTIYGKNQKDKVIIICSKHGEFLQRPSDHLRGGGCPTCFGFNKTTENIIEEFKKIHAENYDYSQTKFIKTKTKLDITCNKCKESFKQLYFDHLSGHACSKCNTLGKISEPKLFEYIKQKFPNEKIISQGRLSWLGAQSFDIYLPDYNIAIEYQGKLHFKSDPYFGGDKQLNITKERDERKYLKSLNNNCVLLYFTYQKQFVPNDWHHKIYTSEQELFLTINNIVNPI